MNIPHKAKGKPSRGNEEYMLKETAQSADLAKKKKNVI